MTSLKRILQGGALCASLAATAAAQSVSPEATQSSRLTELSRKLATRNQDNRVPSVGERLGAAIDQTRGRLDWLAGRIEQGDASVDVAGALSEERKKLAVLDEAYETEFANVEAKLRRAGLPPSVLAEKLAIWHAFTTNYRQRMDASQAGFDQLSRKAAGGNASWLLTELSNLRAGLGVDSLQRTDRVSDNDSPRLTSRVVPRATALSPATLADDTPTPDDSAATGIVLLTPDIVNKATAAGNSAAALFALVYNEIQFVPYYGLVQNSESVLWSGRGNDADQATLLIALLRAAKIPARYVMGTISVPVADAISWTGAKDKAGALSFLNLNTTVNDQGTSLSLAHIWVEAWLPNGSKNAWIPMTPSIKRQTFQPGLILARPAFNRPQFLSTMQTPLASEIYADQLHAAFQKAYPGRDFTELAYTGTITPVSATTLPTFPYPPAQIAMRSATFPGHTIGITLATAHTKLFSTSVVMPEVSLEAVTLSFTAASQHDQSIIDSFGGLANVPVGLVNLLPQLRIDGTVTATGTTPTSNGGVIGLTVAHTESFATSPAGTYSHSVTAGEDIALTLGLNQISQALIDARVDRITGELATAKPDDVVRDVLALAGWRYFQRSEIEKARVFPPLQIVPTLTNPEECATYASLKVSNLFDRPFLATPAADTIDATAAQIRGLDLNAGGTEALSVPTDLDPSRAAEAASSGLENELWEELVLVPSVSTIKALQIAGQNKIPQLVINAGNARGLLPTVQGPKALLQSLAQLIVFGDTITISQKPITFGNWSGFGYIDESPGGFGYVIVQLNTPADGGSTAYLPGPFGGPPGSNGNPGNTGGTSCSDPVNVSNGNLYQHQVDLNISSRGPSIVFSRTYNSLSAATPGPLGFGWSHSYGMSIRDMQTSAIFTDSTGGAYTFAISGGSYVSAPGLDLALAKTAQGFTLRAKHGTVWQFNTKGILESITDRNQNTVTLGYTNGNLTTITDALNRVVTLRYDGSHRITEIQDFAGRKLLYAYDALGNLASFTDPVNNRTKYAYYSSSAFPHLLQTVTKPAGNSTSFEYYANHEVARVSDSAGRNMRFFYLPLHNETMFIDPRGFTGSYYYNASGNVTRVVKADGTYKQYAFSTDLKVTSYTDEEGNTTSYTYDAVGNLTSVTDALGHVTKLTYEPTFNHVLSVTNPLGAVTTLDYDGHGNLIGATRPMGVQFRYSYDSFGDLLSLTNGSGSMVTITRDSGGSPVKAVDPLGNTAELKFDSLRRLVSAVDPQGATTSWAYDAINRLASTTNQVGAHIAYDYNPNGNLAKTISSKGFVTTYGYDALDNLAQVTDALGKSSQYSYATPDCGCSSNSDLISFRDATGQTLTYLYDFNERATQVIDPAGNATTFAYSARGDLLKKTDGNGHTIQYEYDAAGHLLKKTYEDGSSVQFTYDANGNLLSASNPNTMVSFKYDQLNRITSTSDSRFGQTIEYTYDQNSHRTGLKDPEGGQTSYTYNANGRLITLKNPSGATIGFSYDSRNLRTGIHFSNGVTTTYMYDPARRVTELKTSGAGPEFQYAYDTNSNPTTIVGPAGTDIYDFDSLNRIAAVKHSKASAESYSYDAAGNRVSSASSKYDYDPAGRLISANGITYSYDSNGDLIKQAGSKGPTSYTYDFENRLTGITFPDGTKASYKYDALGRRIQKVVNGAVTNYLYDGVHLLLELDHQGAMLARYTYGPGIDRVLTVERSKKTYFYHSDRLGSIAALTDSSGKVVCSYGFDSFGNTQPCLALQNAFTFAGREFDSESGLYYMRARYYDPRVGRFLTPDPLDLTGLLMVKQDRRSRLTLLPIAGSRLSDRVANLLRFVPHQLNRYAYVANNPATSRDPSGLQCNGPLAAAVIGPNLPPDLPQPPPPYNPPDDPDPNPDDPNPDPIDPGLNDPNPPVPPVNSANDSNLSEFTPANQEAVEQGAQDIVEGAEAEQGGFDIMKALNMLMDFYETVAGLSEAEAAAAAAATIAPLL